MSPCARLRQVKVVGRSLLSNCCHRLLEEDHVGLGSYMSWGGWAVESVVIEDYVGNGCEGELGLGCCVCGHQGGRGGGAGGRKAVNVEGALSVKVT
eukprot:jgi/Botrbrau1/23679/Bobra.55_2s0060.1